MKFIKDFETFKLNEETVGSFNVKNLQLKFIIDKFDDNKITGAKWALVYNNDKIEEGVADINFSSNPQTPSYQGTINFKSEKSPVKSIPFSISKGEVKQGAQLTVIQKTNDPKITNFLANIIEKRVEKTPIEIILADGFEMDKSTLKPETITQIKEKLSAQPDLKGQTLFVATGASQDGDVNQVLDNKDGKPKRKDYDFNLVVQRYATLKTLLTSEGYKVEFKSYPKKEGEKIYGVYQKFNKDAPADASNRNLVISSTPHSASIDNLNYTAV